ncbi:MAG: G/U mismatch-specific DNA glycosylase [Acidimicrobiia bacterium]
MSERHTRRATAPARRANRRPSPDELAAAAGGTVDDVIGPGLRVLFCGINPGLWSGAVGHHFAHPGNRFWKALQASGFTDAVLDPADERRLLDVGLGVTNLVPQATRSASELDREQLRRGARDLEGKVRRWRPRAVALLGLTAYRAGFARPRARVGRQPDSLEGALLWVLPNPSGVQAHYPFDRLVDELRALRRATARG